MIGGYEVDFRIIDCPIVLECDGWATHGLDRAQFEKDRDRDAELAALGYVVLRFTYRRSSRRPARRPSGSAATSCAGRRTSFRAAIARRVRRDSRPERGEIPAQMSGEGGSWRAGRAAPAT